MKDYATAKERLANPYSKWITEALKDALITVSCVFIFILLITQPNGVI